MRSFPKFRVFYSYLVVCLYFIFGLYLIIHGWYLISAMQNYALGGILIVYAFFRLYREVRLEKIDKEELIGEENPES